MKELLSITITTKGYLIEDGTNRSRAIFVQKKQLSRNEKLRYIEDALKCVLNDMVLIRKNGWGEEREKFKSITIESRSLIEILFDSIPFTERRKLRKIKIAKDSLKMLLEAKKAYNAYRINGGSKKKW